MNHGTKVEELPAIMKERLATSLRAKIEYRQMIADANTKERDIVMSNLHRVKIEICKSILPQYSSSPKIQAPLLS
jgi:hypothetical protein